MVSTEVKFVSGIIPFVVLVAMSVFICMPSSTLGQSLDLLHPSHDFDGYSSIQIWNMDTVFLGGLNKTFLRSTNAGASWESIDGIPDSTSIHRIVKTEHFIVLSPFPEVNTAQEADSLKGILLSYSPRLGSMTSIQYPKGKSRNRLNALSAKNTTIGLILGYQTLLISKNEGLTWTEMALPDSLEWTDLSVKDSATMCALTRKPKGSAPMQWYFTTDGGQLWRPIPNSVVNKDDYTAGSAQPAGWGGELFGFVAAGATVSVTRDGGLTWTPILGIPWDGNTFIFEAGEMQGDGAFVLATGQGAVYFSNDLGTTWSVIRKEHFLGRSFNIMSMASFPGGRVLLADAFGGVCRTMDGGTTWEQQAHDSRLLTSQFMMHTPSHGYAKATDGEGVGRSWRTRDGWTGLQEFQDDGGVLVTPGLAYAR